MSELSKQALQVENNQSFPNNTTGYITPTLLRGFNSNVIDSTVNQSGYTSDSGSWNSKINQLNAFTASQQPTFNALNSFTASQLTINSGVNGFTQSASGRLNNLEAYTASFTTSVGIYDESVFVQNVNQINFMGNGIIASYVSGKAVIGVDFTPLNDFTASQLTINSGYNSFTSSENAKNTTLASVTASLNASASTFSQFSSSQNIINQSVTASISQLLSFSSSLDVTYATDAQLNASASALQANIDTKLNTASFNDYTSSQVGTNLFTSSINTYTASNDTKWSTIGLLTGSYATTGSNTFIGNQIISGSTIMSGSLTIRNSLTITGSVYGNVSASTITSSTASIDLSVANYFTLTLSGATKINVTNPQPGVTATLVINTDTGASASFSSNVKQPSGSFYAASPSGNIDIISFTAVNNTTVFAFPAQSFV
jgi:hypothetical protein